MTPVFTIRKKLFQSALESVEIRTFLCLPILPKFSSYSSVSSRSRFKDVRSFNGGNISRPSYKTTAREGIETSDLKCVLHAWKLSFNCLNMKINFC